MRSISCRGAKRPTASSLFELYDEGGFERVSKPSERAESDGPVLRAQEPIKQRPAGTHSRGEDERGEPLKLHGLTHPIRQLLLDARHLPMFQFAYFRILRCHFNFQLQPSGKAPRGCSHRSTSRDCELTRDVRASSGPRLVDNLQATRWAIDPRPVDVLPACFYNV